MRVAKFFETALINWLARHRSFLPTRVERRIARKAQKLVSKEQYQRQVVADASVIRTAGTLRTDFFYGVSNTVDKSRDAATHYLSQAGTSKRKPEPGFHPLIFAEFNTVGGADPYATFLRQGRPDGPWLQEVIQGGRVATHRAKASGVLSALHIHAYFTHSIPEIINRLHHNTHLPDIYFTTSSRESAAEIAEYMKRYRGRTKRIDVFTNTGRDIAPLLTGIGSILIEEYEIVGHVHVKKSSHLADELVTAWTGFLYENLLGGDQGLAMADQILDQFVDDQHLGLVFPDDPHIIGWTRNRNEAERLARAMGCERLPDNFNFPVGTMFWIRSAALKTFIEQKLDWSDYPAEPVPYDGSMLHALERLFGIVPELKGWKCAVTNIKGVTR